MTWFVARHLDQLRHWVPYMHILGVLKVALLWLYSCCKEKLFYIQPATRRMWQWGIWLQNCSYSYPPCSLLPAVASKKKNKWVKIITVKYLTVIKIALLQSQVLNCGVQQPLWYLLCTCTMCIWVLFIYSFIWVTVISLWLLHWAEIHTMYQEFKFSALPLHPHTSISKILLQ
jgi:hypothetical protein